VPLFEEHAVGNSVEVTVLIPAQYGNNSHESGRCKCPVSFERYQFPSIELMPIGRYTHVLYILNKIDVSGYPYWWVK
jgi:hypothetical protein